MHVIVCIHETNTLDDVFNACIVLHAVAHDLPIEFIYEWISLVYILVYSA